MCNVLTIDRGNTAIKVAVWEHADMCISESMTICESVQQIADVAGRYDAKRAISCSVSGDLEGITEALARVGCSLMELTHDTPVPLSIDYSPVWQLGLDRIAAAVGARSVCADSDLLVVDVGTAVTYDHVSAEGRFTGGNIAPGVDMRLRALHAFTSALPEVSVSGATPLLGTSTHTAMRAGAINGVVAEVTWYRSKLRAGTQVIVTGGRGAEIVERLDFEARYVPSLVTLGLNCILRYNESK